MTKQGIAELDDAAAGAKVMRQMDEAGLWKVAPKLDKALAAQGTAKGIDRLGCIADQIGR